MAVVTPAARYIRRAGGECACAGARACDLGCHRDKDVTGDASVTSIGAARGAVKADGRSAGDAGGAEVLFLGMSREKKSLEVVQVFLKLGLTAFGGPVAHLGYFRDEFVGRRQWLDEATFA